MDASQTLIFGLPGLELTPDYAKTIKYIWADYRTAPDVEATWFIDPPYQAVKRGYHSNIDYDALAKWCRSRKGLVIVCEQAGATWLPFKPLVSIKGTNNKVSTEAVWIQRS